MGNYNRDRGSGGRDNRRSFSNNRSDRPEMHSATCAECGNECRVPFRPTGDKPVYCSDCFGGKQESRPRRSDSGRFNSGRSDSRRFDSSSERKMYVVTCDDCGSKCEVPFRPSGDKPVYCNDCFGGKREKSQGSGKSNNHSDDLSKKLDKVIALLTVLVPASELAKLDSPSSKTSKDSKKADAKKESKKEEPKKEEKIEEAKPKAKAKAKKTATKKAPAKAKAKAKKVVKKKK